MKKSNNSNFIILIFEYSNYRNIGRSTFGRSKFWPPLRKCMIAFLSFLCINIKPVFFHPINVSIVFPQLKMLQKNALKFLFA